MTDAERIVKLKEAERLIREVEFSYPMDHPTRTSIYKVIVHNFSFLGTIGQLIMNLKSAEEQRIREERNRELDHEPA